METMSEAMWDGGIFGQEGGSTKETEPDLVMIW